MMRQFVSIFTFFLLNKTFATLLCLRAIMNFIRLVMYNAYIEKTLNYLQTTLHNIDRLKCVFKNSRSMNRKTKRRYFNFSKFHVIIHYLKNIRDFDNAIEMNNLYDENAHKFIIKDFYDRTNKNFDFNKQILMHNIRRQNFLIMNDMLFHARFKFVINVDKMNIFEINIISRNSIKLQN